MKKSVLLVLIGDRKDYAVNVQKVLTGWGCIIKTRLGIHDGVLDDCSNQGLLMMELAGTQEQNEELTRKLTLVKGVTAKLVELEVEPTQDA